MEHFIRNLPKIELHAHLNGSLSTESIKELGLQIYGENSEEFLKMIQKFSHFAEGDRLEDCFQKFTFMHDLTSSKKGLQLATEMVIRDFALDNVIYLELRTTPKSNDQMDRREYLNVIVDVIKRKSKEYKMEIKLLVSINRSESIQVAEEILEITIDLKNNNADIVKGMDLSGNPYVGNFKDFQNVLEKAKRNNLKLALHCGEIDNDLEIQEMLDFDFDRCGHGTFLSDLQLDQCFAQNITIECCLTSNVKCGTVKSYDSHHFIKASEKNVKTVLCTDDSGVFSTSLSREFLIACEVFKLNKNRIKELSYNAIEACFADRETKIRLHSIIDKYFENCS